MNVHLTNVSVQKHGVTSGCWSAKEGGRETGGEGGRRGRKGGEEGKGRREGWNREEGKWWSEEEGREKGGGGREVGRDVGKKGGRKGGREVERKKGREKNISRSGFLGLLLTHASHSCSVCSYIPSRNGEVLLSHCSCNSSCDRTGSGCGQGVLRLMLGFSLVPRLLVGGDVRG